MVYTSQSKGKGIISLLTAGLGLYFTAAMWTEFNSALGLLFGPSLGIIVGTIVFLLYQSKKNENEFTEGGNYLTSEATQIIQDDEGRSQIIESVIEKGRNPTFLIGGIYLLIVLMSESSWSDLLF
ncbi:MAG: hypothetical protein OSA21_04200 [Candidatus Poseidoniaceae archaeon]|nr:hypothetical protein [Candidatus Poseidoniaceae archaeon]